LFGKFNANLNKKRDSGFVTNSKLLSYLSLLSYSDEYRHTSAQATDQWCCALLQETEDSEGLFGQNVQTRVLVRQQLY